MAEARDYQAQPTYAVDGTQLAVDALQMMFPTAKVVGSADGEPSVDRRVFALLDYRTVDEQMAQLEAAVRESSMPIGVASMMTAANDRLHELADQGDVKLLDWPWCREQMDSYLH